MTSCPEQSRAVQTDSRLVQSSPPPLRGWTPGQTTTDDPRRDRMTNTPRTGYVCRDHHSQPVNHRGKGCTLCPPPRTKKPKRRKAPETIEEWWTQ